LNVVFDKEEQENVDSWIKELRKIRKEVEQTNFSDIADYCVARREETIKLFLEMAEFLENNIDVFYNPNWKWVQSSKYRDALMNINNPVLGYSRKSDFIHLWIPGGIKFLLRLSDGRVLWITHERHPRYIHSETNSDMERWHYNFFNFLDAGQYPGFGYEKYVKTPAYENYFGNRPETPQGYFNLKQKVDEDWENAKVCRDCLKEAIASIHTCDKELLSQIKNVKADVRLTRKDEGF
jgi:hypothetical protein